MAFYFGDNSDIIVGSLFEELAPAGMHITTTHPEEMSLKDLGRTLVVCRLVFKEAKARKLDRAIILTILEYHDLVFELYCQGNPKFVQRLRKGYHHYLGEMSRPNQRKYWRLAGLPTGDSAS